MSVRIMTKIWEMKGLSPVEKLSLLALADWANDDGLAWPSIKQIADKTGCGRRTVQLAFAKAEKMGILTRNQVAGKGCNYIIDPRTTCTPAPHAPVQDMPKGGAPHAPNTLVTHHTSEPKGSSVKRSRKKCSKPDNVSDEVWNDFVDHRKALKAPVSQTAINGISREAEKAGWTLEDALAECISRGWRGFKAEWVKKDEQNGRNNGKSGSVTENAVAGARARMEAIRSGSGSGNGSDSVERIGQMPNAVRSIGHVSR